MRRKIVRKLEERKKIIFKRKFYVALSVFLTFGLSSGLDSTLRLGPQQEEVTVIAVEVPVRVLDNGRFVEGLTKSDFEIYENGIKQEITAFESRSRRISVPADVSAEELKNKPGKRVFFLIFNIFDYTEPVGEAIDYFFEKIFRKGDQIAILTEGVLFNMGTGRGVSRNVQDLKDTLKNFKAISTAQVYRPYRELRFEADRLLSALRGGSRDTSLENAIVKFYQNYERIWLEYKEQFIAPDIDLYRSLIKRAKAVEGEKWAICFQQREMFPKLKNEGPLDRKIRELAEGATTDPVKSVMQRNIKSKQMRLMRMFDVSENMSAETLKNLFMEANITFHLILLKSMRPFVTKDFELREVAQDFEDSFKQITFSTGGYTAFSNNAVEAMEKASRTEDHYYLLVYYTKEDNPKKKLNIEVKVKREGARVVHLKKFSTEKSIPVSITDFGSGEKTIRFSIENYQRVRTGNELSGMAQVEITLFDEDSNKVYDEAKTLRLVEEETHISIPFPQLKSGDYFIIIQVIDRVANHVDVFSKQIKL